MTAIAPSDLELEGQAVGAVLAGWLARDLFPEGLCYDLRHERLLAAAATIECRHYDVRDGRVVFALDGLDVGEADRVLGEQLAAAAPVVSKADIDRLVDLARRRRLLLALADAYDAVSAGDDIGNVLGIVGAAA